MLEMLEVPEVLQMLTVLEILQVLQMLEVLQMLGMLETFETFQMVLDAPPWGGTPPLPAGRRRKPGSKTSHFTYCLGPRQRGRHIPI